MVRRDAAGIHDLVPSSRSHAFHTDVGTSSREMEIMSPLTRGTQLVGPSFPAVPSTILVTPVGPSSRRYCRKLCS